MEYHHLGDSKNTFYRSAKQFRQDLQDDYDLGFRPVTASEYLSGRLPIPPGASPMVFTFDDANPDQIKFNDDGTLAPDCFLGIWQEFAKTHPDFPIRATFFVLPQMWGQDKWVDKKLALLKQLGCELGNHTISHPILRKLTDEQVEQEIGEAELRLQKMGAASPTSLALPFGVSPKNRKLLEGFDYKGVRIAPKAVFLVGAEPAPSPTDKKFNRLRIPRIQACESPFGITYWLKLFREGHVKVFVTGQS